MSRRMNTTARGRQSQHSSTRKTIKLTFGGKTGTKNGARELTSLNKPTKKRRAPSFSEAESTTTGGDSDEDGALDDDSEEADDESEDPEADALFHSNSLRRGTGLKISDTIDARSEGFSDPGEWAGFPELPDQEPFEWDVAMNAKLFDSDDDLEYEKVNEVSDMEDDDEGGTSAETELLTAELSEDMTSHFANQIDGMSAYGFGDNSDDEGSILFPWSSSDEANEANDRYVRFEEPSDLSEQRKVGMPSAFNVFGHSPSMARALLPSALPDSASDGDDHKAGLDSDDDGVDSDATEELEAPAQTWRMASTRRIVRPESSPQVPVARRSPGQKGPVRGTFEDDGAKVVATLDPTGKKLVIQDAHLLGGVFARKYGPSVPASPSNSFASAVLNESDASESVANTPRPSISQPAFDLMLPALTTGQHASNNGQASGLPEAFMPADQAWFGEIFSAEMDEESDDDCPDGKLRLEDMITFDKHDEDEEDNPPDSPLAQTKSLSNNCFSTPNTPLAHLNHMNVTAFKRKAEPNFFNDTRPSPMKNKFATPLRRKRKSTYDSPYNDAHYAGVTPLQRVTYEEHELSSSPAPSSARMHKRRKTIL